MGPQFCIFKSCNRMKVYKRSEGEEAVITGRSPVHENCAVACTKQVLFVNELVSGIS